MKNQIFIITLLLICIGCNQTTKVRRGNTLPSYTTLSAVRLYTGHGKCGDVLIPTIKREVTAQDRETLLRNIMKKEGWVIISAFSTKEAFDQRTCDSFPDRAPAFKTGYIGKIDEDGKFYDWLEWVCRAARGFPYCLVLQYQSPTLRVGFFYDQSLTLKQAWRSHLAIKKGLNFRWGLRSWSCTRRDSNPKPSHP